MQAIHAYNGTCKQENEGILFVCWLGLGLAAAAVVVYSNWGAGRRGGRGSLCGQCGV